MKKYYIVLIIFILLFSVTACQPTPKTNLVAQKNQDLEVINETNNAKPLAEHKIPEQIKDTFNTKNGFLDVEINADIVMPNTQTFNIFGITPKDITIEDVQKYIDVFFGNNRIDNAKPVTIVTKKDVTDSIEEMQNYLEELKNADITRYNQEKDLIENDIKKQFSRLETENLPMEFEYTPISLLEFREPDGMVPELAKNYSELRISSEISPSDRAEIKVFKNSSNKMNYITYDNRKEGQFGQVALKNIEMPIGLNIKKEEAEKTVLEKLKQLGVSNVACTDIVLKPTIPSAYTATVVDLSKTDMYYELYFSKILDDVEYNYINNSDLDFIRIRENNVEYAEPWADEVISVCIDDTGVFAISHNQVSEITNKLKENVSILPFESIMEKFETQIAIENVWLDDQQFEHMTFYIDKIKLGYAKVMQPNNQNEYMLVPVWDFYGSYKVKYSDEIVDANFNENNEFIAPSSFALSFLTINAIDGSVVSRTVGY